MAQRKVEVLARGRVVRSEASDVIAGIELHRLTRISTTAASAQNRREDFPVDVAAAQNQGDAAAAHRLAFLKKGG